MFRRNSRALDAAKGTMVMADPGTSPVKGVLSIGSKIAHFQTGGRYDEKALEEYRATRTRLRKIPTNGLIKLAAEIGFLGNRQHLLTGETTQPWMIS